MTAKLTAYSKSATIDSLYYDEWRSIREGSTLTVPLGYSWPGAGEDELEESSAGIDADPDAIWLERAGFGDVVNKLQYGNGVDEGGDILGTCVLPRKHEAVVRKRMNTLRSTLRRQRDGEKKSRSDVRNLFNSSNRQTSPTKSAGVLPTAIRPLHSRGVDGSPRVSPSPSPGSSPRASPTPSRHLLQSPGHSTAPHSTLTTSQQQSTASNPIGRQPVSSAEIVRGSKSISDRDRHRGFKIRQKPAHHQSSDSGILSMDIGSSNEFLNDGHSGSPEPPPLASNHRPSPPSDLRVAELSPASSTDSPTPEDIKLDFRTPQFTGSNGSNGSNDMSDLPNFMVMPDALGLTYINDLSPPDMDKVRSVTLVELTITFDDHNLPLRPRRATKLKNVPENCVFGVPLTTLLQTDQQRVPHTQIPLIMEEMMSYIENSCLDEEGLLRVPGNASRLQVFKQEIDSKFNQGEFSFKDMKASDACSLLKMFIRQLPVPLLTKEYLSAFASIAEITDLKEQVRTLNLLVLLLPTVHQAVLKRLLKFFQHIIENCGTNKMDLFNVSMVIAPNLFMALPSRHALEEVGIATKTSQIVRLLIKYHQLLWTIPGEMLRQIRYLYDIEMKKLSTRSVQKALKQMQRKEPSMASIHDPQSGPHIVKVKAPLYTRVCMAVDITHGMTAGDIVLKLQKRSRLNKDVIRRRVSGFNFTESFFKGTSSPVDDSEDSKDVNPGEQFVFEVGGNIGERCLAPDTDMCSLYKVNPNAQWVIKPRDWPDV